MPRNPTATNPDTAARAKLRRRYAQVKAHAQGEGPEARNAARILEQMQDEHPWLKGTAHTNTRTSAAFAWVQQALASALTPAQEKAQRFAAVAATRAVDRFEQQATAYLNSTIDNTIDQLFSPQSQEPIMARRPPARSARSRTATKPKPPARLTIAELLESISFSGRILMQDDREEPSAEDAVAIILYVDRMDVAEKLAVTLADTPSAERRFLKMLLTALNDTIDGEAPGDCPVWEMLEGEEEEDESEEE